MKAVREQNARARAAREEGAAGLIGRHARGSLGRRRYSAKREERTQEELDMKAFEAQMKAVAAENARLQFVREMKAANVLQACGRGQAGRKQVGLLRMRQLDRRADAAAYDVLMAAVAAEVEAMAARRQAQCAVMLQMAVRRWAGRKVLAAKREAHRRRCVETVDAADSRGYSSVVLHRLRCAGCV